VNITLIDPPPFKIIEIHDAPECSRLGLGYIAGFLKNRGISCSVIDAKSEMLHLGEVEERVREQKPDIVGITAMTHEVTQADIVAKLVRRISPNVIVVLGGPHATTLPDQTLVEFPSFDAVVFGEGEYTFYELVTAIEKQGSLEGIQGVAYRTKNHIHMNEPREFNKNLDALPFPAWDMFPKSTTYSIITTRGCPFNCNFCMRVLGNKVRRRTPRNVIEELERDVEAFGAKFIHFYDETFAINKESANHVLDLMIERGLHTKIKWDAITRVDVADYELFRKMKAAGCDYVGFGVESGDEQILKATQKGITKNQATSSIKMAKRVGLKTGSYFIIGHPFETRGTAQETIDFATKLNTTTVAFGIMVPYPGTKVYEMAKAGSGGYKIISTDWKDFNKTIGNSLELEHLSRKEMEKLELLAYLKFYLGNLRFLSLIKLFLNQRRVIFKAIKKLLS